MKKISYYIITLILTLLLHSCAESSNIRYSNEINGDYGGWREFFVKWDSYIRNAQYDSLIMSATPLFHEGKQTRNEEKIIYPGLYLSQVYTLTENLDSVQFYIDYIYPYKNNTPPLIESLIDNIAATYALKVELNYAKALDLFLQAYNRLEGQEEYSNQVGFLSNIIYIYYLRGDTLGVKHIEQARNLISAHNIAKYPLCLFEISAAKLYYLIGDYEQSISLLNSAHKIVEEKKYNGALSTIYVSFADIYKNKGDYDISKEFYEKALNASSYAEPATLTNILLSYADLYELQNDLPTALELCLKGLNISYEYKNVEFRRGLLSKISRIYALSGDSLGAEKYEREFKSHRDSILNFRKEREFSYLQLLHQQDEHDKVIKMKELELLRAHKKHTIYASATVLASFLILFIFLLYKKKNQMYSQLVDKHQQYMLRINSSNVELDDDCNDSSNADKILFYKLEKLMREDKIFKQKDISMDKIAEMLCTNRTYLSKAINSVSKMSFFHYINMYRINEATALLSDPNYDDSFKQISDSLGYNSISVFYRAFQKETGCTPSRYRREMLKKSI